MKQFVTFLICLAAFSVHPVVRAQSPRGADALLEAARKKEMLSGDLEGAIRQYKEILAKHASNRAAAAAALVRMGQCYEKLGDAEARKAYERTVRDFADQKSFVDEARARLAAMGGAPKATGAISLRRVDSGDRFRQARGVSAEGKLIGFSDIANGGSQGLYDTVTRQEKILLKFDWNGTDYGAFSSLSRDGKWLAFATHQYAATNAELRIVRADGSGMRTIHQLTGKSWIEPKDWTPDNRQVLAQISQAGTTHLCLVNAADGSVSRLKQITASEAPAFLSPSGKFILYSDQAASAGPPNAQRSARIMAIDGAGDQALLPNGQQARPLGWSPDGNGVLLLSSKSGEPGLWHLPVSNGKASGEPRLLRSGMPASTSPVGVTADGRFYFTEAVQKSDSFLVQLDAGAGAPGKPARVTPQFEGSNGYASWSPDGSKLAWFGFTRSGTFLHIRSLATGREKTLAFPVSPAYTTPQWLADNRTIVYLIGATENTDRRSLHAFDTETSESRFLADAASNFFTLTRDGGMLYRVADPGFDKITALNVRTKAETQLADLGDRRTFHMAVSPDGRTLACVVFPKTQSTPKRLVVFDTASGQSHDLGEIRPGGLTFYRGSIGWTPDGANIVVRTGEGLLAYPASGGDPKTLLPFDGRIFDVAFSPNGKTLAFTRSSEQHDLWVLEDFLPPTPSAR